MVLRFSKAKGLVCSSHRVVLVAMAVLILGLSASAGTVSVSTPSNGQTVGTPIHVVASASSSSPIVSLQLYLDGRLVVDRASSKIDEYVSASSGSRKITIKAWDSQGQQFSQVRYVTVSGSSTNPSVSSPSSGATVASPIHVVASASASTPITAMQVYVDGSMVVNKTYTNKLDTYVSAASGTRKLTIKAWDSRGASYSQVRYVTVSGTSSGSTGGTTISIPSGAKTFSNIDQMTGWGSCSSCAGAWGSGPVAPYSMQIGVSNPSRDGRSAQFNLGGSVPYSNALWWKQLGANSGVRNFVYDLYFYIKNPDASQALEFDVNQSTGGKKYIFGTECTFKDGAVWKVWDYTRGWISTGIACSKPAAYTWHHLTFEFQRTSDNRVKFISVTMNGKKSYINRVYNGQPSGANEVNVAFQMDGDYKQTDYSVWLDNVKLSYW